MKIIVRGYEPIVINDALLCSGEVESFGAGTSYVARLAAELRKPSYLTGRLPAKLMCLEALKERTGPVSSYAEPMAGVGLSARVLGGGDLYLNDLAEDCRQVLRANFSGEPTAGDLERCEFRCGDLTFLDFNNFTLSRWLRGAWSIPIDYVAAAFGRYVIVNDCTPFYFRYGTASYDVYSRLLGHVLTDPPEYFRAAARVWRERTGLRLLKVAYFRDSSFQLFGRESGADDPEIVEISRPDPIVHLET